MRTWIRRRGARVGVGLLAAAVALAVVSQVGPYSSPSSRGKPEPSGGWAPLSLLALLLAIAGAASAGRRGDGCGPGRLVALVLIGVLLAFAWTLLFYLGAAQSDSC
jgi:hypothetical protein